MTHDPLCPCTPTGFDIPLRARDEFCQCDLIAKVRSDERSRCIAEVEALGPLQQFRTQKGQDGYLIEGYEIVDAAEALRSQP